MASETRDRTDPGLAGLGRMGLPLAQRLHDVGYRPAGYDPDAERRRLFVDAGGLACEDLSRLAAALQRPRRIALVIPAGPPVDAALAELVPALEAEDIVLDFGNGHYADARRRSAELAERGIGFLDTGMSGGVQGARTGPCLSVGGDETLYQEVKPLLEALACPGGLAYVGPSGYGHLVKTVHNGIEYGFLQALGEGFATLAAAAEAEGAPLDLGAIARLWSNGSIIQSRLMEDAERALQLLAEDANAERFPGRIGGGETGTWARELARRFATETPALDAALEARARSREKPGFAGRLIAAIRAVFGQHDPRGR